PKVMRDTISIVFNGFSAKLSGTGEGMDFGKVGGMRGLLPGLYIIGSLFTFMMQYLMTSVAQNTVYDLRTDMFTKLKKLPLKYYDSHSHGYTLSRVINDLDTIGNTLQQSITQFIRSVVLLLGITIMVFTISPLLTVVAFVSLPLSLFVIRPFLKRSQQYFLRQQNTLGNFNGHVEEMYK